MAGTVYFSIRRKKPGHDLIGQRVPILATGLELHGEYQGSGFTQPQYIARRRDGQVLQMSRLLYLVSTEIDGQRSIGDIARRVTSSYGRTVSVRNIDYLIHNQLRSLGIVSDNTNGDTPNVPSLNHLLALTGKRVLIPETTVGTVARLLSWTHHPIVVVPVLVSLVVFDIWLFGSVAAIQALVSVISTPLLMLAVLGLTLASLLFHEFGHASACHYSGARPGAIGCGIYLIWPALYTDVTDVYRASKAGRLRTDFGGVYFNIIYILGMAGCYAATGHPVFLAAAFAIHFEILEQLLPVVRLDGYFILGDLAGVPDLFGKVRPILLSVLRRKTDDPRITDLKRSTRVVVTVWVLTVFPLLVGNLVYAIWNLPRILNATMLTASATVASLVADWNGDRYASAALDVISLVFLVIPSIGLIYLLIRMLVQGAHKLIAVTAERPRLRFSLIATTMLLSSSIIVAWILIGL